MKSEQDYYLVQHGKCAALGSFGAAACLHLKRGDQVVVQGPRGLERGNVLGPASVRQSRLVGDAGVILRAWTVADEENQKRRHALAESLFQTAHAFGVTAQVEVLDVDMPLEGPAILQTLVATDTSADAFLEQLKKHFDCEIRLENLVGAVPALEEAHAHGEEAGCGKPDCGKTESGGGGGCSSCGTGGCSTCGAGQVDLRPYFAHLRGQMEETMRVPLH